MIFRILCPSSPCCPLPRARMPRLGAFRFWIRSSPDHPAALFDSVETADSRQAEPVHRPTRPMDLDAVYLRRLPQAEVHPEIVARSEAAPADHIRPLAYAASRQINGSSDRVARTLRSSHQSDSDPVVGVRVNIAQKRGNVVQLV